ncbi:MAG: sugar MFS transporter [Calditrichaeota bacterium]|nr:sugar MFS transporter [Calditrichota bacterium]
MRRAVPIYLAFLVMGFGDVVGPLVGLAKEEFVLSNTVAFLLTFVGFIMFGLLSVPMGIFQDRKGKKFVLQMGLVIALLGLILPIINMNTFALLLLAVLFLGAGATILQVAGNPIMRDVSEEGKYARNLSLGQFVKAIGSLSGPILPVLAARYWGADWKIVFPVYSVFIIITLISVSTLKVEEKKFDNSKPATFKSCFALLKNNYVLMMVLAIFIYVGAEVSMSSGIPLYLKDQFQIDIQKLGLLGTGLFFTALMVGRFLGGVILTWVKAKTFFIVTSVAAIISILGLFMGSQTLAIFSVILIGLSFANIFPLVFSITIDHMPEKTNELSGLMIMAIVGGAIIPPIMGMVSDLTSSTLMGFLVPLVAILYVTWSAVVNLTRA